MIETNARAIRPASTRPIVLGSVHPIFVGSTGFDDVSRFLPFRKEQ